MPNLQWEAAHELEYPHTTVTPPGAFPVTPILDPLTVDGPLSVNWVTPWSASGYTIAISGGAAVPTNTDGNFPGDAYWAPIASFLDGEVYISIDTINLVTNGEIGVVCRADNTQSFPGGIHAGINNDGVDQTLVVSDNLGMFGSYLVVPVAGDAFGLNFSGASVEVWYFSGSWTLLDTLTTTLLTPGRIGMVVRATDAAVAFGGGEVTAPAPTTTPESLPFNVALGEQNLFFQILPDYKIVPSLRVIDDNISQADGSVLRPRWKTGLVATFTFKIMVVGSDSGTPKYDWKPACDLPLRYAWQWITKALNQLREFADAGVNQRLLWTPSDDPDLPLQSTRRMLDEVLLLNWPTPTFDATDQSWTIDVALETPFPYAIDETQQTVTIVDAATHTFDDFVTFSTADFFPVYRIHSVSGTTSFTIVNSGTGELVAFDSSRPAASAIPAGQYLEIDTFRGTAFLNGSGADYDPGIDVTTTDYFPLDCIDATELFFTGDGGATLDVLFNNAYS